MKESNITKIKRALRSTKAITGKAGEKKKEKKKKREKKSK